MRYRTRWYVTTDEVEARRLATLDGSTWDQIEVTPDAVPLHIDSGERSWCYWSDGKMTDAPSRGLMRAWADAGTIDERLARIKRECDEARALEPRLPRVTRHGERIVSNLRGSDSGERHGIEWPEILSVQDRTEKVLRSGAGRGSYARLQLIEIDVVLLLDEGRMRRIWYEVTVGYSEGYVYDIFANRDEAEARFDALAGAT